MSRLSLVSLSLVIAIVGASVARGAEDERPATVEDTAGVKTEVTGLKFSGQRGIGRFIPYNSSNALEILAKPFEVGINLDSVKMIRARGAGIFEVGYVWMDRDVTVAGPLGDGVFSGKSDLGEITVPAGKIKRVAFTEPPRQLSVGAKKQLDERVNRNKAMIALLDGKEVAVSDLHRHHSFWSSEGYFIGGETRYRHYDDFRLKRGETLATVEFSRLKTIELTGSRVTVTLVNGTTATGTLSDESGAGVTGFAGINDNGEFFVNGKLVKRIVFR